MRPRGGPGSPSVRSKRCIDADCGHNVSAHFKDAPAVPSAYIATATRTFPAPVASFVPATTIASPANALAVSAASIIGADLLGVTNGH